MKNKKKSIFLASAILGSVALVSVGFASWVITSTPEPHAETGEIVVDTVEDKRISFVADSFAWTNNQNKIIYGGKTPADTVTNPWLTNSTADKQENLSATLSFKVENYTEIEKITVSLQVVEKANTATDATAKWTQAVTDGYVAALPTVADITSFTAVDGSTTQGSASLTLNFNWGTAFDSKNPIDYYNAKAYTDELATEAKTKLEGLKTALEGLSFKLTLTVVAASN